MSAPDYDPKADPLDNIARGLFAIADRATTEADGEPK